MNESIFERTHFGSDDAADISVGQAEKVCADGTDADESVADRDFLELLSHVKNLMPDPDEETDESDMDSDDYHNKAVDYARWNKCREAAEICQQGLRKFPFNVDLMADMIKYSSKAGDMQTANDYYTALKTKVPFRCWNWRAFTFSFDYLLKADPVANEDECRTIISQYKKFLPYEEKACVAESELESALGRPDVSMDVLKEAVRTHTNASQCALRLADMQMDRGLFEDVLTTTNYGIAASAEVQPSINVPYLYYIRTLAKDHLLHKKVYEGKPVTAEEVNALSEEYKLLASEFLELKRHAHTIGMRAKMLKFIKAE